MLATVNWNEVAAVMTLGTFVMVWVIVLLRVGVKLRAKREQTSNSPVPRPRQQDVWQRVAAAARLHRWAVSHPRHPADSATRSLCTRWTLWQVTQDISALF